MKNEVFQKMFDMIQPFLPDEWQKMIFFVGYTKGSYSMKFYSCDSSGHYTDCFRQINSDKAQLIKLFMAIDRILSGERSQLGEKEQWSVMTMIVDHEGNMKTSFDYTDISENVLSYEKIWKETYLR